MQSRFGRFDNTTRHWQEPRSDITKIDAQTAGSRRMEKIGSSVGVHGRTDKSYRTPVHRWNYNIRLNFFSYVLLLFFTCKLPAYGNTVFHVSCGIHGPFGFLKPVFFFPLPALVFLFSRPTAGVCSNENFLTPQQYLPRPDPKRRIIL